MENSVVSNIKRLLEERHLTQKELAESIGVSGGTLSDWLKGRFYPRQKYIIAMSEYFNVQQAEITQEKDTNPDERLVSLFNGLSDSKKEQVIDYMKYLLSQKK